MTAREKILELEWTRAEPRSGYDAAIFAVLAALVEELDTLRDEVRHIGYVQTGGEAS